MKQMCHLLKHQMQLLLDLMLNQILKQKNLPKVKMLKLNFFNIIYKAIEYVEKSLSGLLEPDRKESIEGTAEILKKFLNFLNLEKLLVLKLQMVKLKIILKQELLETAKLYMMDK